jgi:hypothetical protein
MAIIQLVKPRPMEWNAMHCMGYRHRKVLTKPAKLDQNCNFWQQISCAFHGPLSAPRGVSFWDPLHEIRIVHQYFISGPYLGATLKNKEKHLECSGPHDKMCFYWQNLLKQVKKYRHSVTIIVRSLCYWLNIFISWRLNLIISYK